MLISALYPELHAHGDKSDRRNSIAQPQQHRLKDIMKIVTRNINQGANCYRYKRRKKNDPAYNTGCAYRTTGVSDSNNNS